MGGPGLFGALGEKNTSAWVLTRQILAQCLSNLQSYSHFVFANVDWLRLNVTPKAEVHPIIVSLKSIHRFMRYFVNSQTQLLLSVAGDKEQKIMDVLAKVSVCLIV